MLAPNISVGIGIGVDVGVNIGISIGLDHCQAIFYRFMYHPLAKIVSLTALTLV